MNNPLLSSLDSYEHTAHTATIPATVPHHHINGRSVRPTNLAVMRSILFEVIFIGLVRGEPFGPVTWARVQENAKDALGHFVCENPDSPLQEAMAYLRGLEGLSPNRGLPPGGTRV